MVEKTLERLRWEKGRILVVSHIDPDGDAVGSTLALYHFLKKIGKTVDVVLKDPVPRNLQFLPGVHEILQDPQLPYDLTVVVDASSFSRTGFDPVPEFGEILRIDHHITGDQYSTFDYLDNTQPSCGLLILHLIRAYDPEIIDRDIATCLFTALSTDTGSFKYLNSDPEVFEAAADLVRKGAHPGEIAKLVYQRKSLTSVRIQARVLQNLKIVANGRVAYVVVTRKDLEETGALPEETDSLANYVLSIEGVAVGIKFLEDEGFWRISFRGKGVVDLAAIAESLGGGGHRNASGARVPGTQEEVVSKVLSIVENALHSLDLNTVAL